MLARRFTIVCLLMTLFGMFFAILVADAGRTAATTDGWHAPPASGAKIFLPIREPKTDSQDRNEEASEHHEPPPQPRPSSASGCCRERSLMMLVISRPFLPFQPGARPTIEPHDRAPRGQPAARHGFQSPWKPEGNAERCADFVGSPLPCPHQGHLYWVMEKRIYPEPIESVVSPEPFARQSFTDAARSGSRAASALYAATPRSCATPSARSRKAPTPTGATAPTIRKSASPRLPSPGRLPPGLWPHAIARPLSRPR